PYSFQIQGQGGQPPYQWGIVTGTLPNGVSFDTATGLISGTPVTGTGAASPYAIEFGLTDAAPATVTRTYDLFVDSPGGWGGGTPTGTITVVVVDGETQQPLPGAFVMIGSAPDVPFAGNFATTDVAGVAQFTDPYLNNPPTPPMVTAGADLRQYTTVAGADASEFVLPLDLIVDPNSRSRISGLVTGLNTTPLVNLHAGILIPPVRLSELFNIRIENLFIGEDCTCMGCDKIILPGNMSYPQQDVFSLFPGDEVREKSYFIDLEDNSTQHLAVTAGFIDGATLLGFIAGGAPTRLSLFTQLQVEGFGMVRDYTVAGPANVDIPFTIGLGAPVDVTVLSAPRGTDVFLVAAADIDGSGGTGQIIASDFGFVARDQTLPQSDTFTTVPDLWPWGAAPTKVALAAAFYDADSGILPLPPFNLEFAYSLLADRTTPFTTPGGILIDSFFDLMPLDNTDITGGSRTFTYPSVQDTINPNSPVPHFTLSQIARYWEFAPAALPDPNPGAHCPPTSGPLDCDELAGAIPVCPAPSDEAMSEIHWEIYTPGSTASTSFTLPVLPPSAPRAADEGLFDPAATPQLDVRRWTALSFHVGLDPSLVYDRFSFGGTDNNATHVSLNYVNY
ncbi:MAG: Ig domain-containing protein, partial [Planctomycetota bacterium]|nr:Ig domain-containing protein [Planctomycetota bacterium]